MNYCLLLRELPSKADKLNLKYLVIRFSPLRWNLLYLYIPNTDHCPTGAHLLLSTYYEFISITFDLFFLILDATLLNNVLDVLKLLQGVVSHPRVTCKNIISHLYSSMVVVFATCVFLLKIHLLYFNHFWDSLSAKEAFVQVPKIYAPLDLSTYFV